MIGKLTAWWCFFRVSIEERLVYRGDFALGTLMRFLPIVTQIFLWYAIFETIRASGNANHIAGYGYHDMVAYYLLAMISRAFSSMPGLTSGIARQIQNGEVKKFLIQPVDMLGCLFVQRIAHKLVYYLIAIIPFSFVFFLCRGFFDSGWPPAEITIAYGLSLIMGFILGFCIEACIGLIGFWWLEVTSITFVYMLLNFFLSGHMFPLDLLPTEPVNWQGLVDISPLKYLAYFPAAVFLEKIPPGELWAEIVIELTWMIGFIGLARLLWNRGVKRYSGFGG
ncbi:MAG: ABC-2 family transporter protein [Planctomycetota bacterium]|nr:ABC-2 family transporter protein [Planctomycetota bacterium]